MTTEDLNDCSLSLKDDAVVLTGVIPGTSDPTPFAALPSILRVLLLQDGTVTRTLAGHFCELIAVRPIDHQVESPTRNSGSCASAGQTLIRRVRIMGAKSGRLYCVAESVIELEYLPHGIAEQLLNGLIGIGELLRNRQIETYRELIDCRIVKDFDELGCCVHRRYRIQFGQRPAINISEYFPLDSFR